MAEAMIPAVMERKSMSREGLSFFMAHSCTSLTTYIQNLQAEGNRLNEVVKGMKV